MSSTELSTTLTTCPDCCAFGDEPHALACPRNDASEVNHPPHYQAAGMEAIDVIEAFELGFNLGNAVKYILRAGRKGKRGIDIEKAVWYLERELGRGKPCSDRKPGKGA
jgi:hypothetical protein